MEKSILRFALAALLSVRLFGFTAHCISNSSSSHNKHSKKKKKRGGQWEKDLATYSPSLTVTSDGASNANYN